MEIVVVIAHAILLRLEELGAILVAVQANLDVQEVQEAPEVCQEDQEEQQDHRRK